MLYQLSYFRKNKPHQSMHPSFVNDIATPTGSTSGPRWIRTTEGVRQQIYSLPQLATLVTSRVLLLSREEFASLVFPEGIGSFHSAAPRSTSPIPLWGGFRPAAARRRKKSSFLRNSQPQNSSSFQTSLTVKLFFGYCHRQGLFSSSSRRLSEPMEGFEPPTS